MASFQYKGSVNTKATINNIINLLTKFVSKGIVPCSYNRICARFSQNFWIWQYEDMF